MFWDVNLDNFNPASHPDYTIARILELGNEQAIAWMRQTFSDPKIRQVICADRRISRKSANFWALIYGIPSQDVAALKYS